MKKRIWLLLTITTMMVLLSGCTSEVSKEELKVSIDYSTNEEDDYIILNSPIECTVKLAIEIEYKGNANDIVWEGTIFDEERHDSGITKIKIIKTLKMQAEEIRIIHTSDVNREIFRSDNSRILSAELISQTYMNFGLTLALIIVILVGVIFFTALLGKEVQD